QGALVFDTADDRRRRDRRGEIREALANGSRSSTELADELGITREGVLRWLRQMEATGEVAPTASQRRSSNNRWRLT
ncbi:MAG TPA: helix-turn-helix domain-containing protein, partial [Acidimicrobiales bacterium]|nr:helix-turn-helix domain-containing protein [Acidimicrobiales bacterium]